MSFVVAIHLFLHTCTLANPLKTMSVHSKSKLKLLIKTHLGLYMLSCINILQLKFMATFLGKKDLVISHWSKILPILVKGLLFLPYTNLDRFDFNFLQCSR